MASSGTETFSTFLERWLPHHSARVLEVGAGAGDLTAELIARGHRVVAVDPDAPDGSAIRRVPIEEFRDDGTFDVVVAKRSLHHVGDLDRAFSAIIQALEDGGLLLLHEFCWDLLDESTARWLHEHLDRLNLEVGDGVHDLVETWRGEHDGFATYRDLRERLDRHFHRLAFAWVPYLADDYLGGDAVAARSEAELLRRGAVRAVSFHYAGRWAP